MDSPKVRELREERGRSCREAAQDAGVAESTLRCAERGEPVRLATARKVAAYLEEDLAEIARVQRR